MPYVLAVAWMLMLIHSPEEAGRIEAIKNLKIALVKQKIRLLVGSTCNLESNILLAEKNGLVLSITAYSLKDTQMSNGFNQS